MCFNYYVCVICIDGFFLNNDLKLKKKSYMNHVHYNRNLYKLSSEFLKRINNLQKHNKW